MYRVIAVCEDGIPLLAVTPPMDVRDEVLPRGAIYLCHSSSLGKFSEIRYEVAQLVYDHYRQNRPLPEGPFPKLDGLNSYTSERSAPRKPY